jgi:hypothetical protein
MLSDVSIFIEQRFEGKAEAGNIAIRVKGLSDGANTFFIFGQSEPACNTLPPTLPLTRDRRLKCGAEFLDLRGF